MTEGSIFLLITLPVSVRLTASPVFAFQCTVQGDSSAPEFSEPKSEHAQAFHRKS